MKPLFKILVYGFGNPGRQDDGLGIMLVKSLEDWAAGENLTNIDFDSNYQLNIEDAEIIRNYDLVVFADASVEKDLPGEVTITRLTGENELVFTSHAASPGYIVHLCASLFDRKPEAFLLHLKGYEWDFKEGLSSRGEHNLGKALNLMQQLLTDPELFSGFR